MNSPAQPLNASLQSRLTWTRFVAYLRATWRPVLIGDLSRIDVPQIAFGLGFDIVLCGVGGAFSLLIAASALALPPETRVTIWIGCAFALAAAVDRPSFKPLLGLPLVLLIVTVGSVTLSALVAALPLDWVVYFALSQGVVVGSAAAFAVLMFILLGAQIVEEIGKAVMGDNRLLVHPPATKG